MALQEATSDSINTKGRSCSGPFESVRDIRVKPAYLLRKLNVQFAECRSNHATAWASRAAARPEIL